VLIFLNLKKAKGKMSDKAPKVFDYLNYHVFLKDLYVLRKAKNRIFSYRYFSNQLDLDAGFLVKVTQGKMALPEKCLPALIKLCDFHGREAEYLRELVLYGRAKAIKAIKIHFENMIALRGLDSRKVEIDQYAFYQKWYHSAIHCLLMFHNFKGDFKALAAKMSPPISVKEAKESVQQLLDLGFVKKSPQGKYESTDVRLTSGEKWQSAAIRNFQEECWRLAGEAWTRHPKEVRDLSTVTLTVASSNLEEIRNRIREFRQSLLYMGTDGGEPDSVYQLNIQLFPLTETGK
jgi:uncharacterized protein (TIGR02147 family)